MIAIYIHTYYLFVNFVVAVVAFAFIFASSVLTRIVRNNVEQYDFGLTWTSYLRAITWLYYLMYR